VNDNCLSINENDFTYLIRRFYIDGFFDRRVKEHFKAGMRVLDIGGKKIRKRGYFNIENYSLKVEYANINPDVKPDYLCDASAIPCKNNLYDGIILGEILEHVPDPKAVLKEAYRILKKGGKVLITVPFMMCIHADPYDYGRYTDHYWNVTAEEIGFKVVDIERQGTIYAVVANITKIWANQQLNHFKLTRVKQVAIKKIVPLLIKYLMYLESISQRENELYKAHTTGFGIVLEKSEF